MRVLLLHDSTPDTGVADALLTSGHGVVRCSEPGRPAFPCAGLEGSCPLDGTVDVTVVVHDRPTTEIARGEAGVVCSFRDAVPVVLAGNGSFSPFLGRCDAVAASVDDVPAACERAVAAAEARASDDVTAFVGAPAIVTRRGDAVKVVLAADATSRHTVRAHQAAARLFPSARTIDVSAGVEPPKGGPR
jgi:hypothetical protein